VATGASRTLLSSSGLELDHEFSGHPRPRSVTSMPRSLAHQRTCMASSPLAGALGGPRAGRGAPPAEALLAAADASDAVTVEFIEHAPSDPRSQALIVRAGRGSPFRRSCGVISSHLHHPENGESRVSRER